MTSIPLDPQKSRDLVDFLHKLKRQNVRFVVVGAYAVMSHSRTVRATKDLDVYVAPDEENLKRCAQALGSFGAPADLATVEALRPQDAAKFSGLTFGLPPARIDILTKMQIPYADVEPERVEFDLVGIAIPVISKQHLLQLKRIALLDDPSRKKDKADIEALEGRTRTRPRRR